MSTLMNYALGAKPPPGLEPSLLIGTKNTPPLLKFYIDDILSGFASPEAQFDFRVNHFFPRIEWARLSLSFKKLRLFVYKVVASGVED